MALPTQDEFLAALSSVNDPEINKPITELGMVRDVVVSDDGLVTVGVYLTVSGCPLKDTITRDVTAAVGALEGVREVKVDLDVMSDDQRRALREQLRGGQAEREVPFAKP